MKWYLCQTNSYFQYIMLSEELAEVYLNADLHNDNGENFESREIDSYYWCIE